MPSHCAELVVLVNCMTQPKFYAVKKGLAPGIYTTWVECQEQTKGVSGAAFKSFSTQQAAYQYLEAGVEPLAKKRKHRHSSSLHSSQEEAVLDPLGTSYSETRGFSQATAPKLHAAHARVPDWIKPDRMYRLVRIWACHLTFTSCHGKRPSEGISVCHSLLEPDG